MPNPSTPQDLRRANRNTLWASLFVEELVRGGVSVACVSPGSRSTPLTLALARQPGMTVYTLLDERGAAFFALGLAKSAGQPVALVCTSGTAAANYLPAVVEAHLSRVPLILLTADRPPLLREVGAGQTIDQLKLFGGAVRWFFEVGEPVMRPEDLRHLRGLAARAIHESCGAHPGPVHLNFPFRKPLEPEQVPGDVPLELEVHAAAGDAPYSRGYAAAPALPPPNVVRALAARVAAAPRGLILCGPRDPVPRPGTGTAPGARRWEDPARAEGEWAAAITRLAEHTGYPVLTEPPAGLHAGPHASSHLIRYSEALLRHAPFRTALQPQLILRFGAMPTPRHVEVLLEEHPECPRLVVHPSGAWLEPTHGPAEFITADPAAFCRALADSLVRMRTDPEWLARFQRAEVQAEQAVREAFSAPEPEGLADHWFEGRVYWELAPLLPEGTRQFTASSMPVRDLAYFAPRTPKPLRHLVSRGANGIDGTLSTALGMAASGFLLEPPSRPAVLITGDVAFLHDANALAAAKQYRPPLLVVLINNDGGGIFEFLPIREWAPAYEAHFGTPHGTDFSALCAAHDIPHHRPGTWGEFRTRAAQALAEGGTQVLEIRTQRARNREQHARLWAAVARALEGRNP
ncbi:MAG: 2-succinyl-5-enolpyruvyl-6-hydroxy-3-cyclohexene-1-carboxylic-acid synthase [Deltaproteobacteria bacterium]|nr:2-succinyl-5-enolpyruvyl-6-hydroxy-3-cyclohexene-1-carboxylic-acid synthase [Deltaproteobacteria bacterium]